MVRRIYVEKKKGFDIEAQSLYEDLKGNLSVKGLSSVRVVNRYDVEGIDDVTYHAAKYTIFAEPAIDCVFEEEIAIEVGSVFFFVEYLPGQYDQRADSAAQCIQLMNAGSAPIVRFARLIVLSGVISPAELSAIKKYCINPVDSQEAAAAKPERLDLRMEAPQKVALVAGFIDMNAEALAAYGTSQGFAMSEADLQFVQAYFATEEGRNPTVTEMRVIDTYWSDHCRHTTFLTKINEVTFAEGTYPSLVQSAFDEYIKIRAAVYGDNTKKSMSLMDMAVIGTKYLKQKGLVDDLDESEEINACSIKVKAVVDDRVEDWIVMFKNETHNHPTEIEPFGGAATCLGGAIRDPLSGRVYVYQAMRVTGSGDPRARLEDTLPGKLPQRVITTGAARGYSSYGNQIGLATGQVTEIYDAGYAAKRMEIGAVIGAAPASHIRREQPLAGDVIILIGGRTGRDGCGGATGSSKGHTEESILTCGAEVQKGNPPVERNIQRFFRREEASRLIKRCNDFGAGGVSVAIGELADGIDVDLDAVPKKYEGLDGTELAISESQERMAAVIAAADAHEFIGYAAEENLEATVVARVTDEGRFRMYWQGDCILDLSRAFLDSNGVQQEIDIAVGDRALSQSYPTNVAEKIEQNVHTGVHGERNQGTKEEAYKEDFKEDLYKQLMDSLRDLNCASQKGLVEMFDSTIGAGTVLMPLGGKYQLSPAVGMAAKLPVTSGETDTATLMTYGFDPTLSAMSPFHGAYYAVIDSVTKIAAMGGDIAKVRLTLQEYFERLGRDSEKWAKPFAALLGALKAQTDLELPAIGGKDSMSGSFMDLHVPPTLVSFAVGISEASRVISSELKRTDSTLVLLPAGKNQDGLLNMEQYRAGMQQVRALAQEGKILSANVIGKGGLFVSLVKMAVGNHIGAVLENLTEDELTQAAYGGLLLEIDQAIIADKREGFNTIEKLFDLGAKIIGKTVAQSEITIEERLTFSLDEIIKVWTAPLEGVFPTKWKSEMTAESAAVEAISYQERARCKPSIKIARPKVLIPVFQGTNCEVDTRRAFEKAGADTTIQLVRNLNPADLTASIDALVKNIKQSQIVMLPGGFSGGDEPDGSAKFITAVFRNPAVMEAVTELLENRDGLMLGICNGFQALIKLGLLPYGKITSPDAKSPTLTYNRIGRHVSCLVQTRIASVKSPWLAYTQVGDIHTVPVSHGEGRFIAEEAVLAQLVRNGQIAAQYVDFEGNPSMEAAFNPNESVLAVEAITSTDGRILGKMAHSERIGKNLYKNVVGENDQKIFEAGVDYFK